MKADEVQSHSTTMGSFDPGSGVWTIGELKDQRAYLRPVNGRDGEVLTIIPNRSADRRR